MSEKVKIFDDPATRRDIIASSDPAHQKRLGRSVSQLQPSLLGRHLDDIVYQGNLDKVSTPLFCQQLLETRDKFLAEASTHDLVWVIGFRAAGWQALRPQQWRELHLLDELPMTSLTTTPSQCRPTRVLLSNDGIQEICVTMAPPTGTAALDQPIPFSFQQQLRHVLWSLPLHPD